MTFAVCQRPLLDLLEAGQLSLVAPATDSLPAAQPVVASRRLDTGTADLRLEKRGPCPVARPVDALACLPREPEHLRENLIAVRVSRQVRRLRGCERQCPRVHEVVQLERQSTFGFTCMCRSASGSSTSTVKLGCRGEGAAPGPRRLRSMRTGSTEHNMATLFTIQSHVHQSRRRTQRTRALYPARADRRPTGDRFLDDSLSRRDHHFHRRVGSESGLHCCLDVLQRERVRDGAVERDTRSWCSASMARVES